MNKRPNIIFMFCDDLGWGDVSCLNPESRINTPNIDALAASGVSFTDAHCAASQCTPSRYTLLTGRYCWRTQLKSGAHGGYSPALLRPGRETVASLLRRAGYRSACIGKWHIGMDWAMVGEAPPHGISANEHDWDSKVDFAQPIRNAPTEVGFDYYFGISASLDMPPYVFIENDRVTEIPRALIPAGKEEARAREGIAAEGWTHEAVLPTLRDKAVAFIKENAGRNPFFLYLPVNGPHTPVVPNKEWIGKSGCGIYGDFVMEIDGVLGDIVRTVAETGLTDNTLIFFSSDNGPETITAKYKDTYGHASAWRWRGMKRDNWEGGHRVPLIASWPGTIKAGSHCKQVVELADFFATVSEITSITHGPNAGEDSYCMLPLLLGNEAPNYRDFAVHHSSQGKWAIRTGAWKLLLHSGSGGNRVPCPEDNDPVQLYDLGVDPFETTNVYSLHPELVTKLKALCLKCIEEGRSTPGASQPNDDGGAWTQLKELVELEV